MKLHLVDRRSCNNYSFSVSHHKYPSLLKVWHYHPEIELVLLIKSTGTRFVGDSIETFVPGQLVLLGENLPHMWLNAPEYYTRDSKREAEAIAVHFKLDFLGSEFLHAPELFKVADLLKRARQGMLFNKPTKEIKNIMKELLYCQGVERLSKLLMLLNILSNTTAYEYLSSEGFINSFNQKETNNLKKVYEYIFKNFDEPIQLNKVAEIARMNPSAFSRFFKKIHKKTFTRYLNEIRIGYACKLLMENKHKILAVCYDSGFTNISNFNRQFKLIRGMTPSQFQKFYKLNHTNQYVEPISATGSFAKEEEYKEKY
ncbi:AraC family transcriptional regulator [Salegentibacter maritimus]|uniref:AraC family transcriptional regulator n=1 Tax=Salegentibacter maritimus TaxID=2794347 RepID=UPI0018E43399|nr:AraC family transcriptional regulator [Salegentibacter maritimus]MBI6118247.1 AraC family transcriptional regulator [Salegentibacter maritimus]